MGKPEIAIEQNAQEKIPQEKVIPITDPDGGRRQLERDKEAAFRSRTKERRRTWQRATDAGRDRCDSCFWGRHDRVPVYQGNNEAQDRDGRCKTQPWALCYPIGAGCSAPGSQ
jgi:hypothetical protein